jgi:hypothetical protein
LDRARFPPPRRPAVAWEPAIEPSRSICRCRCLPQRARSLACCLSPFPFRSGAVCCRALARRRVLLPAHAQTRARTHAHALARVISCRRWAPPPCCCVFPVFHRVGRDLASRPNHCWASRSRPCSSVRKMASPPRRRASPGASPHGRAHARVLDQAVAFVHLSSARRTRPRCPDLPSPPRRASARPPSHTRRSLELATPTSTLNCSVPPPPTSPCLCSLPFGFFPRRKIQSVATTTLPPPSGQQANNRLAALILHRKD